MSSKLALYLLGPPQFELDNVAIGIHRRKVAALLIYLGVQGTTQTREFLSALLWPDYKQSKAFTNLRHTLWEIQHAIGEGWLTTDRETIGLRERTNIWMDIREFRSILLEANAQKAPTYRIPFLVDAISLYRGPFLAGFDLDDTPIFNEWAANQTESLQAEFADALSLLTNDYCHIDQAEKAVPHAKKLINLDPLNEDYHRKLMQVYVQAGQPGAALKQYQACEQILRKELNLAPQPETVELYDKIRKGEVLPVQTVKQPESVEPVHNLPVFLSTFIGRKKERREIADLILMHRLVTVTGTGGIGKTRLALELAHDLLSKFPDGVWFLPLESISDPALVLQAVAIVFSIREGSLERSLAQRLREALHDKTALIIFDNCEHVLEVCANLIKVLLTDCPTLRILATSRATLKAEGEIVYSVPPLAVPDAGVAFDELMKYEAVRFFLDRAMRSSASFALTEKNAHPVAEICRKLDGIPLAIELAAAQVNILQTGEILKALNDSFAVFANDDLGTLSRHHTLQASIDWSWRLLNQVEQRFLGQLSVFTGGWTLEAAQAVGTGNALRLISALVKKSLIVVEQESERATRYRLLEMVRNHANDKLVEAGEERDARTRHLRYFLELSEQAEPALRGPAQVEWMARLKDERDNFRTALVWADKNDVEAGLYISSRVLRFWESFDMREENYWLSKFLQNPESHAYPTARVLALYAHLEVLNYLDQTELWQSTAKECLELYRALGDQRGEADVLLLSAEGESNATKRMELFHLAFELSQTLGDAWRQARALHLLGWNHSGGERLTYWGQASTLFRQLGDWRSLAKLLSDIGYFALLEGNLELAQQSLDQASLLSEQLQDKLVKANILSIHGRMAKMAGEYERAHQYLKEEQSIWEELGVRMHLLWCRSHLGYLALAEGNLPEAHGLFTETAHEFLHDHNDTGVIFSLEGMAGLYIAKDKPMVAARLLGWADATREKNSDARPRLEQADVDKIIAACIAEMGKVTFSDAYEAGKKMTIEEAVEFALHQDQNP